MSYINFYHFKYHIHSKIWVIIMLFSEFTKNNNFRQPFLFELDNHLPPAVITVDRGLLAQASQVAQDRFPLDSFIPLAGSYLSRSFNLVQTFSSGHIITILLIKSSFFQERGCSEDERRIHKDGVFFLSMFIELFLSQMFKFYNICHSFFFSIEYWSY